MRQQPPLLDLFLPLLNPPNTDLGLAPSEWGEGEREQGAQTHKYKGKKKKRTFS